MTARSRSAPSRSLGTRAAATGPRGAATATVTSSMGATAAGWISLSPMVSWTRMAYSPAIVQPSARIATSLPATSAVGLAPLAASRRSTGREETAVNRPRVAAAQPRPIDSRRRAVQCTSMRAR